MSATTRPLMNNGTTMHQASSSLAEFACVDCRRLKRRCDKALPQCSLCSRVGRHCDYKDPTTIANGSTSPVRPQHRHMQPTSVNGSPRPAAQYTSSSAANTPKSSPSEPRKRPARWYLDSVATRGSEMTLSRDLLWSEVVTQPTAPSKDEAVSIAGQYFVTTHQWLPIVARRRVTRLLENYCGSATADLAAMLYAMQLVSSGCPDTSLFRYHAVRTALTACEHHNLLTTDYLAAYVLIAVYETGRGMFPSAYFTIGHCSRICYALGLHDKKKATQLFGLYDTWTETEERRRLWWAVIILDRYTHAGFRFRPLAIPSVAFDEIIPASDDEWDNGELAVNPLLVMSIEAETLVSPYARACQAAHLLGKVCQHVNDHPSAEDCDIHFREAVQILRAGKAQNVLVQQDALNTTQPHRLVSARALCLSALLLLTDVHSCIEVDHIEAGGGNRGLRLELQQMAIDEAKATAAETVTFAEELEAHIALYGVTSIGPLVLNSLYSAGATFAWYHRETGSEAHFQKLSKLRHVLGIMKEQWRACNDYLDLLEGTEFTYTGAAFQ